MATFNQEEFQPRMQQGENAKKVRLIGFELEVQREDKNQEGWLQEAVSGLEGFAGYGFDGDDIEVVSDPISRSLLIDGSFIGAITNKLLEHKCSTCSGGGTHINVSKLPSDYKYTFSNLLWLQMVFVTQMRKVFGRATTWARNPAELMLTQVNRKFDRKKFISSKMFNPMLELNLEVENIPQEFSQNHNKAILITEKGNRYEFRGGKSSVNELELLAWGEFCANIVDAAAKTSIEGVKFSQFIKGPHVEKYFNEVVQRNNSRKLTAKDLSKTARSTQKITITETRNTIY